MDIKVIHRSVVRSIIIPITTPVYSPVTGSLPTLSLNFAANVYKVEVV